MLLRQLWRRDVYVQYAPPQCRRAGSDAARGRVKVTLVRGGGSGGAVAVVVVAVALLHQGRGRVSHDGEV